MQPDITAPGVNILAAFSEAAPITDLTSDNRHVPFNVLSGTSMACPHVAGVAALLKGAHPDWSPAAIKSAIMTTGTSMACPHVAGVAALLKGAHPDWSPAAIKSAIMTTATTMDNTKEPIKNASRQIAGPFNYGAGHVNPNAVGNPGLVYDLEMEDYYSFLCSLNYNSRQMKAITGKAFSCAAGQHKIHDFNYPSITVSKLKGSVTVKRRVTNVAKGPATYKAKVEYPPGVLVSVEPEKLEFSNLGEKKSFNVILRATNSSGGEYVFGSLRWEHPQYLVVSPIVVNATTERGQ
eukprot:PITA_20029